MNVVYCLYGEDHAHYCRQSIDTLPENWKPIIYADKPYRRVEGYRQELIPSYFKRPFMETNVLCQLHYLLSGIPGCGLFLDTDVLATHYVEMPEEQLNWDIAVTYREGLGDLSDAMPYNYGVIFARPTVATKMAWCWLLKRIQLMHPTYRNWYGNQMALKELCGPPGAKDEITLRHRDYFDLKVRMLPGKEWNYTPKGGTEDEDWEDLANTQKKFIHLKGNRKSGIEHYYQQVMEARA